MKSWNPDWKPVYFMCDYADEEISSTESVFPGILMILCENIFQIVINRITF